MFYANDGDDAGRQAVEHFKSTVPVPVSHFAAGDLDGCKDVNEYYQRHGTLPPALIAGSAPPEETPLSSHNPHESTQPSWTETTLMDGNESPSWPTLPEMQARVAEAARFTTLTPDDLPSELKAEAEALAAELADDTDEFCQFWADLRRRETLLTAEDRRAAEYVVKLVIESWPDDLEGPSSLSPDTSEAAVAA